MASNKLPEVVLLGVDSAGATGKTTLINNLAADLRLLGARVFVQGQPYAVQDFEGRAIGLQTDRGLLDTREILRRHHLMESSDERVNERRQLELALLIRGWLFTERLPNLAHYTGGAERDLKDGDIVILDRNDLSTVVYQGIGFGGILSDFEERFVTIRRRLGIPMCHSTTVLLDDAETQIARIANRRKTDESDAYDTVERQQLIITRYEKVVASPEELKRMEVSGSTFTTFSSQIEGDPASVTEGMTLLWALTQSLMHGAKFSGDVSDWVTFSSESNSSVGFAEVRVDQILRQVEGGLSPDFKDWVSGRKTRGEFPSVELAYVYRNEPMGRRDHRIAIALRNMLRRSEFLSGFIPWGDFGLALTDYHRETQTFTWEQGLYLKNPPIFVSTRSRDRMAS